MPTVREVVAICFVVTVSVTALVVTPVEADGVAATTAVVDVKVPEPVVPTCSKLRRPVDAGVVKPNWP